MINPGSLTNNSIEFLLDTANINDGNHTIQIEVFYINSQSALSENITVIVDNSIPEWINDGIWVNGISQYNYYDYTSKYGGVCTNDSVDVTLMLQDLQSYITRMEFYLIAPNSVSFTLIDTLFVNKHSLNSIYTLNFTNLNELNIINELGFYTFYVRCIGQSGILQSNPISLYYNTSAPDANFLTFDTETMIFSNEIKLIVETKLEINFIDYIEIQVQFSTGQIISLGFATRILGTTSYQFTFLNTKYNDVNVYFCAIVNDICGNSKLIRTARCYLRPYRIELSQNDSFYHLYTGQNITGSVINYFDYNVVSLKLDAYDGSNYIQIGQDGYGVNEFGEFSIEWNLVEGMNLDNQYVPISLLDISNNSESLLDENIGFSGHYNDTIQNQIILFSISNPNSILRIYLFEKLNQNPFNWSILKLFDTNFEQQILDFKECDMDNNSLNEIYILTNNNLLILKYSIELLSFKFESISLSSLKIFENVCSLQIKNSQIFISTNTKIFAFEFSFNSQEFIKYSIINNQNYISIPSGNSIQVFDLISIQDNFLFIVVTLNKIYMFNCSNSKWIPIFQTNSLLLDKIVLDNLDSDSSIEFIFGISMNINNVANNYDSVIEIIQGDWDLENSTWKFYLTHSYNNIAKIYDINSGQLSLNNYKSIIIANEQGLNIFSTLDFDYITNIPIDTSTYYETSVNEEQSGIAEYIDEIPKQVDTSASRTGKIILSGIHLGFNESGQYNLNAKAALYDTSTLNLLSSYLIQTNSSVYTQFNSTFDNSYLRNSQINSCIVDFENYVELKIKDVDLWGLHNISLSSFEDIPLNLTIFTANTKNKQISSNISYYDYRYNKWSNPQGLSNSLQIIFNKTWGRIPDSIPLKIVSTYIYNNTNPEKDNSNVLETGSLKYILELNNKTSMNVKTNWYDSNKLNNSIQFSLCSIQTPNINITINTGENQNNIDTKRGQYSQEFDVPLTLSSEYFTEKGMLEIKLNGDICHNLWDNLLDDYSDSDVFDRKNMLDWYLLNEDSQLLQILSTKTGEWIDLQSSFVLSSGKYFDLKFYIMFNDLNSIMYDNSYSSFHFRLTLNQSNYIKSYFSSKAHTESYSKSSISINGNQELANYISYYGYSGMGIASDPFIIENLNINPKLGSGFQLENTNSFIVVRNCNISGGIDEYAGIFIHNCQNIRITDNFVSNNFIGIKILDSTNLLLLNNTLSENKYGIILDNSQHIRFLDNPVNDNEKDGIVLKNNCYNVSIYNNFIFNNNGNGLIIEYSSYSKIYGNVITDNQINGILLKQSNFNNLTRNDIKYNIQDGLALINSNNNYIRDNTCSKNQQIGINLTESSCSNLLFRNVITNNILNEAFEKSGCLNNMWDNSSHGNYWGIECTSFAISGDSQNFDEHPLSEPYSIQSSPLRFDLQRKISYLNNNHDSIPFFGLIGSGTREDPYILEGFVIDFSIFYSYNYAISIANTDEYYIIRDCIIRNGGGQKEGITIYNCSNVRIINNNVSNCYYKFGIFLTYNNDYYWEPEVEIHNNEPNWYENVIIYDNCLINNDLTTYSCRNIKMIRNNIIGGKMYADGSTTYSRFIQIQKNDIKEVVNLNDMNDYYTRNPHCLYFSNFKNALISNNSLQNGANGIWGEILDNVVISNNFINNNSENGIVLKSNTNSLLINNYIINNTKSGLSILSFMTTSCIQNNTIIKNKESGFTFYSSGTSFTSNVVIGNKFEYNHQYGMYEVSGYITNNQFYNNSFSYNSYDGINLMGNPVYGNIFSRNSILNNSQSGIRGYNIENNQFQNNLIKNNKLEGFLIDFNWKNNNILNNLIINNSNGIKLGNEFYGGGGIQGNEITQNNITQNRQYGIYIREASYNKIYHNNIISNNLGPACAYIQNSPLYYGGHDNQWDDGIRGNFYGIYYSTYSVINGNPTTEIDHHPLLQSWYIGNITNNAVIPIEINNNDYKSNLINVSLNSIDLTYIVHNKSKIIEYSHYNEEQGFSFSIDKSSITQIVSLNISTRCIFNTTISIQNKQIPIDENFEFRRPIVNFKFQNYYGLFETLPFDLNTKMEFEYDGSGSICEIHWIVDDVVQLYSISQILDYAVYDYSSNTYSFNGKFVLYWAVKNMRMETVCVNTNVIDSQLSLKMNTNTADRHNFELKCNDVRMMNIDDFDNDGDFDILLNSGKILMNQETQACYSLKLTAYNNQTNAIICDKTMLATYSANPVPKIIGIKNPVPEYGEIANLIISEFSNDLTELNLSYSYSLDEVNPDGNYNVVYHKIVEEQSNFHSISLNTTKLDIREGIVFFNVTCVDRYGNLGYTIKKVIIDRTAPLTHLDIKFNNTYFDANDNLCYNISLNNQISIYTSIPSTNCSAIMKSNIYILNQNMEYIYSKEISAEKMIQSNEISQLTYNIDLLHDVINSVSWGSQLPTAQQFMIQWFSIDCAGNIEFMNTLNFTITDNYHIEIYDSAWNLIQNSELVYQYNDLINGKILDSFNQPLPLGYQVNLKLNDLYYITTTIIDNLGKFSTRIKSIDMFSRDFRKTQNLQLETQGGEYFGSYSILAPHPASYEGFTQVDVVKRIFFNKSAGYIKMTYQNFDFSDYDFIEGYEGFCFDLYIPASYNEYTLTTYREIIFEFNSSNVLENGSIQSNIFTYNVNKETIAELYRGSKTYQMYDMDVKRLSVGIPFYVLNNTNLFNLKNIISVSIRGIDNAIHPGFDLMDPTHYNQILAVGGIYLVDQINNATMYYRSNSLGTSRVNTLSAICTKYNQFYVEVKNNYQIIINRMTPQILEWYLEDSPIQYMHYISVRDVVFYSSYSKNISCFSTTDGFYLTAFNQNSQNIFFAMPNSTIQPKMDFLIIATNGTYYDLSMNYTGNAMYNSFGVIIKRENFVVLNQDLFISLTKPVPFANKINILEIDRNGTSTISGIIKDEFDLPKMDSDQNSYGELSLSEYLDTNSDGIKEWVITRSQTIFSNNCALGVYTSDEIKWLNLSEISSGQIGNSLSKGEFEFEINNFDSGNLPLSTGTYLGIVKYFGNTFYNSANLTFEIRILPKKAVLQMNCSTDSTESTTWIDPTIGFSKTTFQYSDTYQLEFRLLDGLDQSVLNNHPVWFQIGLHPYYNNEDLMIKYLRELTGLYLGLDTPSAPAFLTQRNFIQSETGNPISYLYYDDTVSEFRAFAPFYYQMAMTDENGIARFTIDGNLFKDIVKIWEEKLARNINNLSDFNLYARVFYRNIFNLENTKLGETEYYDLPYNMDYLNNGDGVYDYRDDNYPDVPMNYIESVGENFYQDEYHYSSFADGIIHMIEEDTMLYATYQEVVGGGEFVTSVQIIEADTDLSGQIVAESKDSFNFLANYGFPNNHSFRLQMKLYDQENIQIVAQNILNSTSNRKGIALFNNTAEEYGTDWNNIVPNFYTARYSSDIDNSKIYHLPISTTGELLIKSESTFSLDTPTHLYSLPYLINSNTKVEVNSSLTSLSPDYEQLMQYSSEYPIITATVEVKHDQIVPTNFNDTDYITVNGLVNGYTIDSANFYEFSDSQVITKTLEMPLKLFEGLQPNIGFRVNYMLNPEKNISLNDYQISSNYTIKIVNLTLSSMDQQIDLLNRSNVWTYRNGSNQPMHNLETAYYLSQNATSFKYPMFTNESVETALKFVLNKDCIEWSSTVQEIKENMNLSCTYLFFNPILIESYHYNQTIIDSEGNDLISISSGFMTEKAFARTSCVRSGLYYNYSSTGQLLNIQDALYLEINQNQFQEITIPSLYLPYKGKLKWDFILPNLNDNFVDQALMNLKVDILSGETIISSISLNKDTLLMRNGKYINTTIYFDFPSQYYSKFIDLHINFTLTGCKNISGIFLDSAIVGEENIVQMSNTYPPELRARMFSTNFIYYYTQNAFKLGATKIDNPFADSLNDVKYVLESSHDAETKDLRSILNVYNYSVYVSDREKYVSIDNDSELLELFNQNINLETKCELSDTGKSMLKMKFNETAMANIYQPELYSGLVALYDLNSNEYATKLTDRKLTVMINPETWIRQPMYTQLRTTGSSNSIYSTTLTEKNIDLTKGYSKARTLNLEYTLSANTNDIVIDDFSERIRPAGSPSLTTSTVLGRLFYDDKYFKSYFELLRMDSTMCLDGNYLGVKVPISVTNYQFSLNLNKLSGASNYISLDNYEYMQLNLFVNNTDYISSIKIGSQTYSVTDNYFAINTSSYYTKDDLNNGYLNFEIHFNGTSVPAAYQPYLLIQSLTLYQASSVGSIEIKTTKDLNTNPYQNAYSCLLLPTPLTVLTASETLTYSFNLNNSNPTYNPEIINSVTIKGPARSSAVLNLFKMNLKDDDIRINSSEHNIITYYSYDFDANSRSLTHTLSYGFAVDQPDWSGSDIIVDTNKVMIWSQIILKDEDKDGESYEYLEEHFDGEGIGNFDNKIQDVVIYDYDNDGSPEFVDKWDTSYEVSQSSDYMTYSPDPKESSDTTYTNMCVCYLTETRTISHTTMMDTTGDGIFDTVDIYQEVSSLTDPIPSYRETYLNAGSNTFNNYFEQPTDPLLWKSPTKQIVTQYDYDDDQVMDYILVRTDLFPNNATILNSNDKDLIYETYNETVLVNGIYISTVGNTLARDLDFVIAGSDDIFDWKGWDDGSVANVMHGKFIVVEGKSVLVDTRFDDPSVQSVFNNGIVAWYDSNGDGYYELGFIFTRESWERKIALAVYLSKNGSQEIYTDKAQFINSGDDLVATHWLYDQAGYYLRSTDVWQRGYSSSLREYNDYINSDAYKNSMISDCIAQFAIGVIGGIVGTFTGGIGAFVVIAGLNILYQTTIKPALNTLWCNKSDQTHELGGAPPQDAGAAIMNGWSDYFASWGEGWFNQLFTQYKMAAYFSDINPFDIDVFRYSEERQRQDLDYSVWIGYEIPQIWYPNDDSWTANAKFWVPKTDPFYEQFLEWNSYDIGRIMVLSAQNMQHYDLYCLIKTQLGSNTNPTYLQYLEAKAHVLQRYYYRDDPTDDITPASSLASVESSLHRDSQSYKVHLDYTTIKESDKADQIGRPTLTATMGTDTFMNYSDPVAYYVDYLEMCLISKYQTGYESCSQFNDEIAKHQLIDTIILTAVGVAGCFVGSAAGMQLKMLKKFHTKLTFSQAFQKVMTSGVSEGAGTLRKIGWSFGKFAYSILDEMVLEQVTSELMQIGGINAQLADILGESFGMGEVIESIQNYGETATDSKVIKAKERAQQYQTITAIRIRSNDASSTLADNLHQLSQLKTSGQNAHLVACRPMIAQCLMQVFYQNYCQTGGKISQQQLITMAEQLLGMQVHEYDAAQITTRQIQQLLHFKLLAVIDACLGSTTLSDEIGILKQYLDGGMDGEQLGLIDGRYQYLRLQISIKGRSETIDIFTRQNNKDPTEVVVERADGSIELLSDFMQTNQIDSVPALLAMSTGYQMIDPLNRNQLRTNIDLLAQKLRCQGITVDPTIDLSRFFALPFNTIGITSEQFVNLAEFWFKLEKSNVEYCIQNPSLAISTDQIKLIIKNLISEIGPLYISNTQITSSQLNLLLRFRTSFNLFSKENLKNVYSSSTVTDSNGNILFKIAARNSHDLRLNGREICGFEFNTPMDNYYFAETKYYSSTYKQIKACAERNVLETARINLNLNFVGEIINEEFVLNHNTVWDETAGNIKLLSDWVPCVECAFMFLDSLSVYPNLNLEIAYIYTNIEQMKTDFINSNFQRSETSITIGQLCALQFENMDKDQVKPLQKQELAQKIYNMINSESVSVSLKEDLMLNCQNYLNIYM